MIPSVFSILILLLSIKSFSLFQRIYHDYASRISKNWNHQLTNRHCQFELLRVEDWNALTVWFKSLIQDRSVEPRFYLELKSAVEILRVWPEESEVSRKYQPFSTCALASTFNSTPAFFYIVKYIACPVVFHTFFSQIFILVLCEYFPLN